VTFTIFTFASVLTQNDLSLDKRIINNELIAINLKHIDSFTNALRNQNDFSHSDLINYMKIKIFETINAFKIIKIFLHVAISKRSRNDDDHDLEKRIIKRSRAALLTLLACENLNESQDLIINSMLVSQAMIVTVLMTENITLIRMNILTPVTYREAIKNSV